ALWQLARVAVRLASPLPSPSKRDGSFAWLGVWLALAPLAKESDLVVVPLALLTLALLTWRVDPSLRPTLVRGALTTTIVFVALVGWWYVLRYVALGFWFGTTDSAVLPDVTPSVEGIASQWTELEISFWGLFGWNIVPLPQVVYDALHGLTLLAFAGVLLAFARRAYTTNERASLLGLSLFALAVLGAFLRWMSVTGQAHGRLLFPALPAFAVVYCAGLAQFIPARARTPVMLVFSACWIALAAWAGTTVLTAAYPRVQLVAQNALPSDTQFVHANLSDRIELVGYRLHLSGDMVEVMPYWLTNAPVAIDYTVTVQVFAEDGTRIGHLDSFPMHGMSLTHDWRAGEI
ncbi:MAG: hypothetical protein LC737_05630, partial [Chloroflexi bacterium]|nr:hypothetical protein [Chloroflexota bacterium]